MTDIVSDLEARARSRFVRWDGTLWRELVEGPARELAASLEAAGLPKEHGRAVLENYLRLGCEGIGLGYLFPASAGAANFFTLAWTRLIPRGLAALPASRQVATLADCWNLGENLESSPLWLRRIFLRSCGEAQSLGSLESLVSDVAQKALEPPERKLEAPLGVSWVHLAEEDRRFLPGALHFVSPTVACVHDRHRTAAGGRDAATMGVWLSEGPLLLGSMGCKEEPKRDRDLSPNLKRELARLDPRATERFACANNAWRAAITLDTSQFVVVLLPA